MIDTLKPILTIAWKIISSVGLITLLIKFFMDIRRDRIRIEKEGMMQTEIEKLKGDLAKREFVHKVQFEKEFEVYKELWNSLVKCNAAANNFIEERLRSFNLNKKTIAEIDKEILVRAAKLVTAYWNSLAGCRVIYLNNRPFISEKIYNNSKSFVENIENLRQVHNKYRELAKDFIENTFSQKKLDALIEQSDIMNKNAESVKEIIENICLAIRERIHNIEYLP